MPKTINNLAWIILTNRLPTRDKLVNRVVDFELILYVVCHN